jgi:transcriptional regulator with XRE-family HTH domain
MTQRPSASMRPVNLLVGQEIRAARDQAGLTRRELASRLPYPIGERTLLTYEQGNRRIDLDRLIDICDVLGESAPDLLRRALEKAARPSGLRFFVSVVRIAADQTPGFANLQKWAAARLKENRKPVLLAGATVREMAYICGTSHEELAGHLVQFMVDEQHDV